MPSVGIVDAPAYQTLKSLYLEARALPRGERGAFLDQHCAGQAELRAEVESLLSQEETLGGFLEQPAAREAAPEPEPAASHPERIGAYRILKPLGFGGMGVVYLAEQDSPRRMVALKLLRFDSASPRQVERFEREAELLGRLGHPGIARVYEAGWAWRTPGRARGWGARCSSMPTGRGSTSPRAWSSCAAWPRPRTTRTSAASCTAT